MRLETSQPSPTEPAWTLAGNEIQPRIALGRRHDAVFIGLLSAGMLGNSADRLVLGYVRDFLVATPFPTLIFNLADVLIVLGFVLLLGSWALSRRGVPRAARSRGWAAP